MKNLPIHTLDLNFRSRSGTIGAYLVPHPEGCILIETGPGSTINNLIAGMEDIGYEVPDVTDVFLTHIHLDHAGAAGWWAQHGAQIHVHEYGTPHLINPHKLLASASRLYGDMMDTLWGEFLPVQEDRLSIMHDQEVCQIGNLTILALNVPGHASHHLVYLIEDACFSGDIGGIRLSPRQYISLPMPPPEFHLEKWRESIHRIQQHHPKRIIPTHFGVYSDADWQLQAVLDELDEVEAWMEAKLPSNPSLEELRQQFIAFEQIRAEKYGVSRETADAQQIANPSFMSADGILRYWTKYRKPASTTSL
jgi:glyoxylase-like metal-dependent hydrolase (beta-lactamase superfamily II)